MNHDTIKQIQSIFNNILLSLNFIYENNIKDDNPREQIILLDIKHNINKIFIDNTHIEKDTLNKVLPLLRVAGSFLQHTKSITQGSLSKNEAKVIINAVEMLGTINQTLAVSEKK